MESLYPIFLYTVCAGLCIPVGGLLACVPQVRPRWLQNELRHSIIAFGGGVLLAAVALVLVPEGMSLVPDALLQVLIVLCGGLFFFIIERTLGARRREKPQFSAMLLDYIPESLALGGAFAVGSSSAPLLALFIGLQNLPEGFNAYRELRGSEKGSRLRILIFMFLLVPIGPVLALVGWAYFSHHTVWLGATMLFAAGGILYLLFQDIAPQSHMHRHWAPPLGAVLGFCLGMLGKALVSLPH